MKCVKFVYYISCISWKCLNVKFLNIFWKMSGNDNIIWLRKLNSFDRAIYTYGLLLKGIYGSYSSRKLKKVDVSDSIFDLLRKFGSRDWDSGLSSKKIARVLNYSVRQVQNGLSKLLSQGKVKKLTQGRKARYILAR